ncbi:hypothetical protein GNI_061170 [Gregarina niphandrodes]|uniref:Uncharacterized protein n=1 Tax=Gregarina niphandrodes TaxID=110365 RepID=A0A023B8A2_GRENI|nr:hypothetical protein GNI_061170 [Gregarina niphandrodes]EZG68849.1 hypothetical protein GNI_061170 [Gregarina niphandrodes]|eukprot:XP_011134543.1 hypothetical protein GNI_061170 [Gregarina niphandrodes]
MEQQRAFDAVNEGLKDAALCNDYASGELVKRRFVFGESKQIKHC